MRTYVGPLLDSLEPDEILDPDQSVQCDGDWMHSGARHHAITQICVGNRITLRRRKLLPSAGEVPGEVSGYCYGSAHNAGGQILLAIQQDDDECVAVDVTDPSAWHWKVG